MSSSEELGAKHMATEGTMAEQLGELRRGDETNNVTDVVVLF